MNVFYFIVGIYNSTWTLFRDSVCVHYRRDTSNSSILLGWSSFLGGFGVYRMTHTTTTITNTHSSTYHCIHRSCTKRKDLIAVQDMGRKLFPRNNLSDDLVGKANRYLSLRYFSSQH